MADPPTRHDFGQDFAGCAKDVAGCQHMIPMIEQASEGGEDSRHARGERHTSLCALNDAHFFNKFIDIGVGVAAVDATLDLIGKESATMFGILEGKARGHINRSGMFAVIGGGGLGANQFLFDMSWLKARHLKLLL
jgi:hypothetical protein